jgi:hypothetical protein
MRTLLRVPVAGLVAMFSVAPVPSLRAEPGPVGQWLMQEPATLWDLGMLGLRRYIYGWKGTHPLASMARGSDYEWDRNRIVIYVWADEKFDRSRCKDIVIELRKSEGITQRGTYAKESEVKNSVYASFFDRGFRNGNEPKDYLKRLDQIFEVRSYMNGGSCEGPLVSTKVLYSE